MTDIAALVEATYLKARPRRGRRRRPAGAKVASSALLGEVVEDPGALQGVLAVWESLVQATSQPYCSATWLMAWWRHAAPSGARLAVVVVRDAEAGDVVGLAPGFLDRTPAGMRRWRPLGAQNCQRVQPLAQPGREADVALAIRRTLDAHPGRPDVLSLEGVPSSSPWPALLARTDDGPVSDDGPGRGRIVRTGATVAPGMRLSAPSFEAWLATKSAHFRQRLRKDLRTAAKQGCVLRRATVQEAPTDIEVFLTQHAARWEGQGGSSAVTPGVVATLREAGPELVRTGRLQLWALDVNGQTIATRLLFGAGHEVGAWLSSYDPAHQRLRPSMVTMLLAVEAVFAQGAEHFDLGEGVFDYKLRFSDHEQTLLRLLIVLPPPGPRAAVRVGAGLLGALGRRTLAEQLPDARKQQLRALATRRT